MEIIRFQFNGRLADSHEMNFYEAGRFQYGAARLIYTLEKFRQDAVIVSKLNTRVNADIRIRAPQQGSFIQDVIILAAPIIQETAIKCSFNAIFSYVWSLLLSNKHKDVALDIAKIELEREKQKTEQFKLITNAMEGQAAAFSDPISEAIKVMSNVVKEQNITTQQALTILDYAVKRGGLIENDMHGLGGEDIKALRDDARASLEREKIIQENADIFDSINPETEKRLVRQVKKSIVDLTLPLRSSATSLNISNDNDKPPVAYVDDSIVSFITQQSEDTNLSTFRASIKSYDVESGYGKIRYASVGRPIPFRVPGGVKSFLKEKILDAMKQDDVFISAYLIRDAYDNVISMTLDKIIDDIPNE